MLTHKNCTNCNVSFLTYAHNPCCRYCMKDVCCMSHLPSSDGRSECNSTFDTIFHNGKKYCLGHYKLLQNRCNICGVQRPENNLNFQSDHLWYCDIHLKTHKQNLARSIYESLKNHLYLDIILEILKNVVSVAKFRYPAEFHIPVQKTLKQQKNYIIKSRYGSSFN